MPTGMLTKKMARQPSDEIRTPPITGPLTIPTETVVPIQPSALPRSFTGKASTRMAAPRARMSTDPMACTTRNPISQETSGAIPQSADPRVNTTMPAMNSFFLPTTSPRRPMPIVSVAMVSR